MDDLWLLDDDRAVVLLLDVFKALLHFRINFVAFRTGEVVDDKGMEFDDLILLLMGFDNSFGDIGFFKLI